MASNMYRVGDCVYFETSSTTPYQIRRIEELCKTPNGNVEAKVMCFYRRRDISSALVVLADKHQYGVLEEDHEGEKMTPTVEKEELSEKQRHQLKHRELFLSRQVETLPATHIRGKCAITLLNETESFLSYLNKEDFFFYSLVYDPQEKTLLADKGEIRIGSQYQAEPIPSVLESGESDDRDLSQLEELIWQSSTPCTDQQIDQFLIISRSIGTFARSLDCTSTVRQPSLHMSAAAASRDITLFHAMDVLHNENYDITKATQRLVPHSGPVLCRDEMEEWSASEANLFEEALDKYGKDFRDIRQDFLPWKSLKSIVEYYYMWKTTDRYVQQKRIKAAEGESKLKQVYIPNYNKPNPAQIVEKLNGADGMSARSCESCYTYHSSQWYSWGPVHMQCRLCSSCWIYWKKYGGLKMPTKLDGSTVAERLVQMTNVHAHKCHVKGCDKEFSGKSQLEQHILGAHGLAQVGLSESPFLVMKTKSAFCLVTTPLTRISRQVCKGILDICRSARRPFHPINIALIKQECQQRLPELVKKLRLLKAKKRVQMENVSERLGIDVKMDKPSLLQHTAEKKESQRYAFPRRTDPAPSPRTKSSPNDHSGNVVQSGPSSSNRKRGYEHINGTDGGSPPMKYMATGVIRQVVTVKQKEPKMRSSAVNRLNSQGTKNASVVRNRKHNPGLSDTPDDLYFVATESIRKLRKIAPTSLLKRTARIPWRKVQLPSKTSSTTKEKEAEGVVVLD